MSSVVQHDNNNIIIIPTNVNNRNYFSQIVALRNDGIASLYSFPCNDSKERMLTGMINSLGVITKNYYSQLNEGVQYTYSGLYTPGYGAVYPYVNFQGRTYGNRKNRIVPQWGVNGLKRHLLC